VNAFSVAAVQQSTRSWLDTFRSRATRLRTAMVASPSSASTDLVASRAVATRSGSESCRDTASDIFGTLQSRAQVVAQAQQFYACAAQKGKIREQRYSSAQLLRIGRTRGARSMLRADASSVLANPGQADRV